MSEAEESGSRVKTPETACLLILIEIYRNLSNKKPQDTRCILRCLGHDFELYRGENSIGIGMAFEKGRINPPMLFRRRELSIDLSLFVKRLLL